MARIAIMALEGLEEVNYTDLDYAIDKENVDELEKNMSNNRQLLEDHIESVDEGVYATQTLTAVAECLKEITTNMSYSEFNLLNSSIRPLLKRIGVSNKKVVAMESLNKDYDPKIAIESIGKTVADIIKNIKEAIIRVINYIKEFFKNLFNRNEKIEDMVDKEIKEQEKAKGDLKEKVEEFIKKEEKKSSIFTENKNRPLALSHNPNSKEFNYNDELEKKEKLNSEKILKELDERYIHKFLNDTEKEQIIPQNIRNILGPFFKETGLDVGHIFDSNYFNNAIGALIKEHMFDLEHKNTETISNVTFSRIDYTVSTKDNVGYKPEEYDGFYNTINLGEGKLALGDISKFYKNIKLEVSSFEKVSSQRIDILKENIEDEEKNIEKREKQNLPHKESDISSHKEVLAHFNDELKIVNNAVKFHANIIDYYHKKTMAILHLVRISRNNYINQCGHILRRYGTINEIENNSHYVNNV